MAVRDLMNKVKVTQSLTPAARTATGTGNTVDLQGFAAAMAVVQFGAWTDGTHTPSLQHSADGTTYVNCDTNSQSGTFTAVSGTSGSGTVQKVGYTGSYRYIRGVVTVTGATSGALSALAVVTGASSQQPVS